MVRLGTALVTLSVSVALFLGSFLSIGIGVWTGAIAPFHVSTPVGARELHFDTPLFCPEGLEQAVCDTLPGQLPRTLRLQLRSADRAPLQVSLRLPGPTAHG